MGGGNVGGFGGSHRSRFDNSSMTPAVRGKRVLTDLNDTKVLSRDIVRDIELGADLSIRDTAGTTILMRAVVRGDMDIFDALMKRNVDVNEVNRHGETALMMAACANQSKMAMRLLDAGANINACDKNNSNALMSAASHGSLETGSVLLHHTYKADMNAVDINGNTALMLAIASRHVKFASYLVGNDGVQLNMLGGGYMQLAEFARKNGMPSLAKDIEVIGTVRTLKSVEQSSRVIHGKKLIVGAKKP